MDKSIELLGQDLARAGYAKSTQKKYIATATELSKRHPKSLVTLSAADIRAFVDERAGRDKSVSTLNVEIGALSFLYRRTLGVPEKVSFLRYRKRSQPLATVLSLEEVGALLQAMHNPRCQAVAMVMYGAGLRVAEALALEVTDIDGSRGVLIVRHGKGDKPREAKLSESLYRWLRQYWARERPKGTYLFGSKTTGKPPLAVTIRGALAHAAKEARIRKRVTPHVLRHSFATHLLEQGTDMRVVAALLGHSSLSSTMRYTKVTEKLVRQTPSPLDLLPHRRW